MVWPLPPRKFGGCKVSVVGVCQLQCLRRLCGICGSLLVSHSWDPGLGRNYRHGMSRMEFQSDGWVPVVRLWHPPWWDGAQGSKWSFWVHNKGRRCFLWRQIGYWIQVLWEWRALQGPSWILGILLWFLPNWWMGYDIPANHNWGSGMVDGSLVSAILFFFANTLSTKQWEEPNLTGLQMDEHAWIQRQMWGKGRRNSERGKWNSAVLPVQCCLCLGNFSIAPCSKSHLLVFWFLRFSLLPWNILWFFPNLKLCGMSSLCSRAFTCLVVTGTTDYT